MEEESYHEDQIEENSMNESRVDNIWELFEGGQNKDHYEESKEQSLFNPSQKLTFIDNLTNQRQSHSLQ